MPERAIFSEVDLENFKESKTYADFFQFVKFCGEKVRGVAIGDEQKYSVSPSVAKIVSFFGRLKELLEEIPPLKQPMRFGNKAFRDWFKRVVDVEVGVFLTDFLPADKQELLPELEPYVSGSFGNEVRIDYGTGHETCMVIFFYCLFKTGLIREDELCGLILEGFGSYLSTMRAVQQGYMLEPAGSHGVWGLDDYQCLLFVWGSAQLCGNPVDLGPACIHDSAVMSDGALVGRYLYLQGIRFIRTIKSGAPFAETSPMLNDISHLGGWERVHTGLLRLYQGEVLNKLPVVQHVLFGKLFPFASSATPLPAVHLPGGSATAPGAPHAIDPAVACVAPWAKPNAATGGVPLTSTVFSRVHGAPTHNVHATAAAPTVSTVPKVSEQPLHGGNGNSQDI